MKVTEAQVKTILISLLKSDAAQVDAWMNTPIKEFSLQKPKELIAEGRGSEVVAYITRLLPNGRPNQKGGTDA